MGDTPSVEWLLFGDPANPTQPGWGGRFVRAWERTHVVTDRLPTADDRIEQFGIFELVLPLGNAVPESREARMEIGNEALEGAVEGETVRFRFSPNAPKTYAYTLRSSMASLDARLGRMTAFVPAGACRVRRARSTKLVNR